MREVMLGINYYGWMDGWRGTFIASAYYRKGFLIVRWGHFFLWIFVYLFCSCFCFSGACVGEGSFHSLYDEGYIELINIFSVMKRWSYQILSLNTFLKRIGADDGMV